MMNPRIKRFQQGLLCVCIFAAVVGVILMFWGGQYQFIDVGAVIAFMAGALATIPLFYFASQVAFKNKSSKKDAGASKNSTS
jgi:drug/metabolite transporter (DMT)-like permease